MIDMQTVQVSALKNRVPGAVLVFEVAAASVALGLLALYLAILARGVITFDLDRPVRGLVRVPDTPLLDLRESMEQPPAARAPSRPR
jgi:hypothetical protein